jgi:hypothetical protein
MSAALGHLEQAKAELEKAMPNKGGHRERALELSIRPCNKCRKARPITSTAANRNWRRSFERARLPSRAAKF